MPADPLILTAAFDAVSGPWFQALRDRYFPAKLNIVPAHLTLFHALPGVEHDAILERLDREAGAVLPYRTGELRFLGRGVAIEVVCPALMALRQGLVAAWGPWLTAQDRQGFRAHVTVQNKVKPEQARVTLEALAAGAVEQTGALIGLDLWWYRGGPWEPAGSVRWRPAD
ncbi:2'-5' RNA ligase family protein [Lichenihabitans sp. Uapishka_5]|uniref:2'-5' RNA ligase family protein n=1 Tax=Lichenihabitans sp. Uapishka_5 TaxID=3037302 RepID=UPI0029E7FEA0|nr:2'-5' RNA ligase family protein [Lichenihabitans sp. Uapishka_5]MDX7950579.1 2'-5' RNA ligase family protein [Lichenihabitans sp. Uapishka_5]